MPNTLSSARASADVAIAVGEASGDWIGALAIDSLLKQHADWAIEGIAGPKLREVGVVALHQSEELSVRGYVEVLRHLPRLLRMRRGLMQRWAVTNRPRVLVGVDAPDFNLKLEQVVRAAGVPTVQVVCPSIWAWRRERIHTLKQACSHVLCIFPFEPTLLKAAGIPATYIGHPMAPLVPEHIDPRSYRCALGLDQTAEYVAILPGSRGSEVKYLGPVFIQTAVELLKHKPTLQFVTPLPPGSLLEEFKQFIPEPLKPHWTVVAGRSHECMAAANAVLLASGTATLEAMMFKKPMVIAYKMPWLSYQWMKNKGYLPYVGLPNILLNRFAVPEFIQDAANPRDLCKAVLFQLDDERNRQQLEQVFLGQHQALLQPSGDIAADVIERVMRT
ncbi:lipid-A-disaccharide synthase [Limnobacter humi]|uniref:Lipid-A-disaccharide synthase n=1 Tax=Limnobacter humi TaxID=1778671 RepID=A0ABT1WES5_9BURK|nr:lipid-A-disaccharide synthase [Limnobacter humi]MCQ8896023.1 lipid-A-disaccharide synthase [Limnobacter humi]